MLIIIAKLIVFIYLSVGLFVSLTIQLVKEQYRGSQIDPFDPIAFMRDIFIWPWMLKTAKRRVLYKIEQRKTLNPFKLVTWR